MFSRILIPTDLSDRARRPIELTRQLVEGREVNVTLLHVVEEIAQATREELESFYRDLERRSNVKLGELAGGLDSPRIHLTCQVLYGHPVVEISRFAEDQEIDLIVMASHPVDPDQPARGFGAVSHRVALLAPCPVLLVK